MKSISRTLSFKNDTVIITDPCYIAYFLHGYHDHLTEALLRSIGLSLVSSHTQYGDWACSVWTCADGDWRKSAKSKKKRIGEFCADSAAVCVTYGSQIKKKVPEFIPWAKEHTWCACLIPNYTGNVSIHLGVHPFFCEEPIRDENECWVQGDGSIKFISTQTGF